MLIITVYSNIPGLFGLKYPTVANKLTYMHVPLSKTFLSINPTFPCISRTFLCADFAPAAARRVGRQCARFAAAADSSPRRPSVLWCQPGGVFVWRGVTGVDRSDMSLRVPAGGQTKDTARRRAGATGGWGRDWGSRRLGRRTEQVECWGEGLGKLGMKRNGT